MFKLVVAVLLVGLVVSGEASSAKVPSLKSLLPLKSIRGEFCSECVILATTAKKALKSDKTEEELMNALLGVCSLASDQLKPQCDAFVTEYGKACIELLVEKVDFEPKMVCQELKFC